MIDLTTPEARELGFPQAQGFNKLIRKNTFSDGETDLHSLYKTAEQFAWQDQSKTVAVIWKGVVAPTRTGIGYGAFSTLFEHLDAAERFFDLSKRMDSVQRIEDMRRSMPFMGENLKDADRLAYMLLNIALNLETRHVAKESAMAMVKENLAEAYAIYSGTHVLNNKPARPGTHPGGWRGPRVGASQPA